MATAPNMEGEDRDEKCLVAWSIAGSDSGGGAGVQADVRTFQDFGVHPASVVTCVTAQNTVALSESHVLPAAVVRAQIEALRADLAPDAIKIGALGSAENAAAVLGFLQQLAPAQRPFVVWDPVQTATVGGSLGSLPGRTVDALLAAADVVTPNAEELVALGGDAGDPVAAARNLRTRGAGAVLVTGGHGGTPGTDLWASSEREFSLAGDAFPSQGAHGGGCALASALAAARLCEDDIESAPVLAHMYVRQGLRALAHGQAAPGAGRPPLPHLGWPGNVADLPRALDRDETARHPFPRLSHPIGLYAVVATPEWVRRCVELGVDTVQLRMKDASAAELRRAVSECVAATEGSGTRLFVNDHWQEAIRAGAYGVHLGQEDLETADLAAIAAAGIRVGVSTHSYFEIARAHAVAPSYVAIGPIWATTTKPMKFAPQGVERLHRWVRLLAPLYPLTAIGGISTDRVPPAMATGVGSVAVVRAITEAPNARAAVTQLRAAME